MTMQEMDVAKVAASRHQSAEWGMQAFQASFPQIKDRIAFEYRGQCKLTMKMMIVLYSFRARWVGIDCILNDYMLQLAVDVN